MYSYQRSIEWVAPVRRECLFEDPAATAKHAVDFGTDQAHILLGVEALVEEDASATGMTLSASKYQKAVRQALV